MKEKTNVIPEEDKYLLDLIINTNKGVDYSKATLILNRFKDCVDNYELERFIKEDLKVFFEEEDVFVWIYENRNPMHFLRDSLDCVKIDDTMKGKTLREALLDSTDRCEKLAKNFYIAW